MYRGVVLYRKLEVWQDSMSLIKKVYKKAEQLLKSEEYNLKSQLKRAITSVALNIAEGKSRKSAKDFANFLSISSGSLAESSAILEICYELEYINRDDALSNELLLLNKKINSLRKHVLGVKTNV